jgi:hypothetical protein
VTSLTVRLHDIDSARPALITVRALTMAGWSGRDAAATPIAYRVAAARLTTATRIEVVGQATSGEAEFVLLRHQDRLWVGAGSDHTDRKLETHGITWSKQICDKPLCPDFWPLAEVAGHWDRLCLTSEADGAPYQDATLASLLPPDALLKKLGALEEGDVMFGGTVPVIGRVRPAARFAFALTDKVRDRALRHEYAVEALPVAG